MKWIGSFKINYTNNGTQMVKRYLVSGGVFSAIFVVDYGGGNANICI